MVIKSCPNGSQEIEIARHVTSLQDLHNHCLNMLDVFPDPLDPEVTLMVMPFLRPCNDPPFEVIGEVIDFVDQTLEVRSSYSKADLCLLRTGPCFSP